MSILSNLDARRDPYPEYARARGAAPVLREPHTGHWMLFDYASVRRALHDQDAFGSAVAPPDTRTARWLLFTDPPRHGVLRALIARAFTPRAVAELEPRVRELAESLVEPMIARGTTDFVAGFAVPLPLMVIAEMLGAPVAHWPHFRRWSDVIMRLSYAVAGAPEAARAVDAFIEVHGVMQAYLADLLEARRTVPRDDLLSRLLAAEVDGARLTDDEILGFFQLLLLAGHETTTNLLGNAILSFIEHPDALGIVRARPETLSSAIEEVLRHRSPLQAAIRVTRRDVVVRDTTIPAGRIVLAMIGSANRDPNAFAAPDTFDVTRDPNPHVAFGHGMHFCIGAALARLEARVALETFLARAGSFAIAPGQDWTPREAFHVLGASSLPLVLEV